MSYAQRITAPLKTILNAKAANGIGTPINVEHYPINELALDSASSANLTVKFQGSYQKDAPDFSAAQSVSNQWDYIKVRDLQSNDVIAGDTGIAFSAADDNRQLLAETNNLVWICAIVSSYVAGSVTLKIKSASS